VKKDDISKAFDEIRALNKSLATALAAMENWIEQAVESKSAAQFAAIASALSAVRRLRRVEAHKAAVVEQLVVRELMGKGEKLQLSAALKKTIAAMRSAKSAIDKAGRRFRR
jgi:hypothetical protein